MSTLSVSAFAQWDVNGPNAAMTINGTVPSLANATTHDVGVSIPGAMTLAFNSGANANAKIILFASQLNPTGMVTPVVWGGSLDIGAAGPSAMVAIADGYGFTVNPTLDPFFNTGFNKTASFTFAVGNCGQVGSRVALQAVMTDPTNAPFHLDNTEAGDVNFNDGPTLVTLTGDDSTVVVNLGCNPCMFYGALRSQFFVSTNGFIKFNGTATSDLSETTAEFIAGTPGGTAAAPMIAPLWEDLDMGNGVAGQMVIIDRTVPPFIQVKWQNGDYFPSTPFGSVTVTINSLNGDVTMDYSAYLAIPFPSEGIIGVSSGGIAGTLVTAHDHATAGAVNAYASMAAVETIFENFDGTGTPTVGAAHPVDVSGLVLNWTNGGGGNYSLF